VADHHIGFGFATRKVVRVGLEPAHVSVGGLGVSRCGCALVTEVFYFVGVYLFGPISSNSPLPWPNWSLESFHLWSIQ
jgi:hypothetical protein